MTIETLRSRNCASLKTGREPASRVGVFSDLTIMRSLLTGGIKAILAIAALSTAAHWAFRVQRDPQPAPVGLAAIPDPVVTGSIVPRKVERQALTTESGTKGLDQDHLLKLIAGASAEKKTASRSLVAKR